MLLEIRSSCPVVSSVSYCSSAKLQKIYKKVYLIDSLWSKTLSPYTLQLYFKWHFHGYFSVNIFMRKYFFIASVYASMRSEMFYKIDVLENSIKFTGKRLHQNLLSPAQMFSWEFFEIFRKAFFTITEHLRTAVSDFDSIFLLF